jgi:hypothetical protein
MKIINVFGPKSRLVELKDLRTGQVFTCEENWPGYVFMIIWCKQNTKFAFTCLHGPEERDQGQTYGFSIHDEWAKKLCICYDNSELSLGESR